jgi:hypothetical protein
LSLENRARNPSELKIPKPDGFDDKRLADLCASFAENVRLLRESIWKRGLTIAAINPI